MSAFLKLAFLPSLVFGCLLMTSFGSAQNNQIPAPQTPTQQPLQPINQTLNQTQSSLSNQWFGLTSGFINTSYPFGLAFHYGIANPQGIDLRFSASYQVRSGGGALGIGGDTLTTFAQSLPLSFYGGGGAALFIENQSFLLDAHGLLGAEYRFSEYELEEFGVFLEARIGAAVAVGQNIPQPGVPTVGLVIGVNVHF